MNKIIDTITDHRSIRDFNTRPIEAHKIQAIVAAAQAMPSSINGQQTSIIVIQNPLSKKKIAEYAGGQTWIETAPLFILFLTDFYKTHLAAQKNGLKQSIHESIESTLVGAVDVGLNMGAAIIAAESLGLGIVPIGGIRKSPQEMIDLLDLPEMTYPVAGLAIGYANDPSHKKPRLPLETFRHDESYKKQGLMDHIDAYDNLMADYLKDINRQVEGNWSQNTSNIYQHIYFPKVYPTMKVQGFKNDK